MPVLIYEPNASDKIIDIEGSRYLECAKTFPYEQTFRGFFDLWSRYENMHHDSREHELMADSFIRESEEHSFILGLGGFNRYFVKVSGEIMFSKASSRSVSDTEQAEKLGFGIF